MKVLIILGIVASVAGCVEDNGANGVSSAAPNSDEDSVEPAIPVAPMQPAFIAPPALNAPAQIVGFIGEQSRYRLVSTVEATWSMSQECNFPVSLEGTELTWECLEASQCWVDLQATFTEGARDTKISLLCMLGPPTIHSGPPQVFAGEEVNYLVACADTQGYVGVITRSQGDTCGGTIADDGSYIWTPDQNDAGKQCFMGLRCESGTGWTEVHWSIIPLDTM